MTSRTIGMAMAAALGGAVSIASAQSPINSESAMQPSAGTLLLHEMYYYRKVGRDPVGHEQEADESIIVSQLSFGLTSNLSLSFDLPIVYRDARNDDGSHDRGWSVADSKLLAKYRLWQSDTGPTDTSRFSVFGGAQIPGHSDFQTDASNDALNPILGAVFSIVRGRHGFNADLSYELHTGGGADSGDTFRYDASYLFRLAPAQYDAQSHGAWYAMCELNGLAETNGDQELFLSPGLMYEARKFTIDATVMIPIWNDLDHRAETDIILGIGVRISF